MALINSFMTINVSSDTSPKGLVNFLTVDKPNPRKSNFLTDDDLPFEGNKHT